jgi:hypothetical protein
MRKSAVVIPVSALIAGFFGFLIRQMEVNTMFDVATGFAKRDSIVSTILIVMSVAVIALSVLAGSMLSRRMKAENIYSRAFEPRGFAYLAVSFILGVMWLAADIWYFIDVFGAGAMSVLNVIFVFLAAVSAISVIFLARGAYKGRDGGEMLLFSVIPPLFFCFWLIVLYKDNAADPVVLRFAYQCLAIAAAALSTYFSAGFVFRKSASGRTVFSFLVTIFFCAVVLADAVSLPVKIIFGVTMVGAFVNAVVFLRNLGGKYKV